MYNKILIHEKSVQYKLFIYFLVSVNLNQTMFNKISPSFSFWISFEQAYKYNEICVAQRRNKKTDAASNTCDRAIIETASDVPVPILLSNAGRFRVKPIEDTHRAHIPE